MVPLKNGLEMKKKLELILTGFCHLFRITNAELQEQLACRMNQVEMDLMILPVMLTKL